jgi:hypothetical protein
MDIAINSGLSLLELRDVTLARAEEEVAREMTLRLPVAQRNLEELQIEAKRRSEEIESDNNSDLGSGLRNDSRVGLE